MLAERAQRATAPTLFQQREHEVSSRQCGGAGDQNASRPGLPRIARGTVVPPAKPPANLHQEVAHAGLDAGAAAEIVHAQQHPSAARAMVRQVFLCHGNLTHLAAIDRVEHIRVRLRLSRKANAEEQHHMRIGEAADRLGVSQRTIKYYEELGLLVPNRAGGNYRDYDDADLERVERIRKLQKLGYSLGAIREFLKYPREVDESGRRRLRTADLEAALGELEAQLASAQQHVAMARTELEHGIMMVAELEADVRRCRERLARRQEVADGVMPGK